MRIRDEFVMDFAGRDITTKDVLNWYNLRCLAKGNKPTTLRSNLYTLILHPLINEGRVIKLTHGLFHVVELKEVKGEKEQEQDREFERYLQSKLEEHNNK